jgi:sucrose-6-phosphate hydrolase SacC (GH32 family)
MILKCDSKYIVLSVNPGAKKRCLKFFENNMLVYDLQIELDFENPEVEFYLNIERFAGKELELTADQDMILIMEKSDTKYPPLESYTGKYRPEFHFSAQRGWINDPNGLVYYRGLYHMFYQYNPVGCKWGNMTWGHAVSRDLVHWDEKEPALYPDALGTMFSGSAIVDTRNVTGLKKNENDVILLYYTAAGNTDSELSRTQPFTQCLAYSIDGGNTFVKYAGNPIIPFIEHENRDPKVIYDREHEIYVMVLYLTGNRYLLFTSNNLLDWTQKHEIVLMEDAECPDFYPLPLDGDENNIKWVFIGASDRYVIGSFDGNRFIPESETKKLQYSSNSYAAQSWSDIPAEDGRRIRIGWNRYDISTTPFNLSMDFPCEMTLKTFSGETFLCTYPVREIESIYSESFKGYDIRVTNSEKYSRILAERLYDITFHISGTSKSRFVISLFGIEIHGDLENNVLTCLDHKAPLESLNGNVELRILIDVNNIELFINKGKVFLSIGHIQDYTLNSLVIEAIEHEIMLKEVKIAELRNIWRM